jgi:hypothetical protein
MQRRGWVLGGVAVLALAGLVVGLLSGRVGAPATRADATLGDAAPAEWPLAGPVEPRPDAPVDAPRAPATTDARAAPATSPASLPLPPPGAPLAGMIDDLERRARAGDARAACRLAAEIGRCANVSRREAYAAQAQHAPPPSGGPQADPTQIERYVEFAARQQVELESDQALCAGVPQERLRGAAPWMLAAARGGNQAAMLAFTSGLWPMLDPYAMRHAEVFAAYSREAERMALALVESGSPEMMRSLGMAYAAGNPGSPLGAVVDPDPVRGHALLRLLLEHRPSGAPPVPPRPAGVGVTVARALPEQRAFETLDASLDPGQRAASDALFARLGARRDEYDARVRAGARPTRFINSIIQPEACDR